MSRSSIRTAQPHEYFEWLCDLVQINEPDHSFFILARTLHDFIFSPKLSMDENRADDGVKLRDIFCDENNCVMDLCAPCSMLEFIVALAIRMDAVMYGDNECHNVTVWAWDMLSNLELDRFNDEDYYAIGGTAEVAKIINIFAERKFERDGTGGLFPLVDPKEDQRKVQIWYQMQAYLNERYPI